MTEQRAGIGRLTAAFVAAAATLPYLTIKTLWLTGDPVGVSDPTLMESGAMMGLNALTFAMEAAGLLLALAFTMRWGMRLPAWLVLLPLWTGTGLLSVLVVTTPLILLVGGLSVFRGGPIQMWVYLVVYGGFITLGIALMTAFALYARDRWRAVLTTPVALPFPSATRSFQEVVAWGALLVAAVVAGLRVVMAFDGGAPAVQNGLKALLALGGAVALVVLVRRRGNGPFWRPLVLVWLGSGSMFAWGLFSMVVRSTGGPLAYGGSGIADFTELFGMLTGLVMGMCGAFLLAERSGVGHVQPGQDTLEREDGERDREPADHGHR
ncbi:hypothetical protein DMB42_51480 [Nonomuraea sp. WAC 01424]|uniref:hypothetical protein n=1 Tax=Nonomuraea sp. WAC 01424 TaxID=2203200 RepID=UPI000F7A50F8|nr:hypothetical protein [Nonomuraea sp. WAC 01424]RSM94238.1 hypothetical protein DMB42_51480 [Nonomuraea sp. WAC 01424]